MRTVSMNVYRFEELSDDAKQVAIRNHRYINVVSDDWSDEIVKRYEKELKEKGFYDINIRFSGFVRQGDGASFTGKIKPSDAMKLLKISVKHRWFYEIADNYLAIEIRRLPCGYYHEFSVKTVVGNDLNEESDIRRIEDELKRISYNLKEELDNFQQIFSKIIYRVLKEEYEILTSDELVSETLEENDFMEYWSDGNVFDLRKS